MCALMGLHAQAGKGQSTTSTGQFCPSTGGLNFGHQPLLKINFSIEKTTVKKNSNLILFII